MFPWRSMALKRKERELTCLRWVRWRKGELLKSGVTKSAGGYFSDYDRKVCEIIDDFGKKINAKRILDVAGGIGYPYGSYLSERGYEVLGVDINKSAVRECKNLYPEVKGFVSDAESLPFKDMTFDIVFCFHSLWYFPNVGRALDEMISVIRVGGYLFFDFKNLSNSTVKWLYFRSKYLFPLPRAIMKLFPPARFVYNKMSGQEFVMPYWNNIFTHDILTCPERLYNILDKKKDVTFEVLPHEELMSGSGRFKNTNTDTFKYDTRLVFKVRKELETGGS